MSLGWSKRPSGKAAGSELSEATAYRSSRYGQEQAMSVEPQSSRLNPHSSFHITNSTLAIVCFLIIWSIADIALASEDIGNLSANPFDIESSSNPFGKGSPFAPNGINNPYSPYGSPFSNKSATNPFATDAPRLYDQQGNYRGKLSANPYDPDSTSNQFGRYGSPFSPDSLNNQFGAGSPFRPDSPNNPYRKGWKIEGR
jgi:hypothetical protein